jgi:hypothetical protein
MDHVAFGQMLQNIFLGLEVSIMLVMLMIEIERRKK